MGNPILTAASPMLCAHGSTAVAMVSNARVTVAGVPILCVGDPVVVDTCRATPPCRMLRLTGSSRVVASGQPVAVALAAIFDTNGHPPVIVTIQQRVLAK